MTAPAAGQPVEEEFRVGTMAIAWDTDDEVVVIEAQELTERRGRHSRDPADRRRGRRWTALLRVRITGAAARAFVSRAQAIVAAGRPPCPFCGGPLDVGGHVCRGPTATAGRPPAVSAPDDRLDVGPA